MPGHRTAFSRLSGRLRPSFYRHLLLVCLFLLISFVLPGSLVQLSWLGFLYLTLLLGWRLGQPIQPLSGDGRRHRALHDHLYRLLGGVTVVFQLLWQIQPMAFRSLGVPLLTLFSLFIAWSLVRLVKVLGQEKRIDLHLLSGATAGYLLLGLSGGLFLTVLDTVLPGGFRDNLTGLPISVNVFNDPAQVIRAWDLDFSRLNYFAFVSLTTVGYGDITPVLPITRLASLALSVLGPIYIAVVLGVLISRLTTVQTPSPQQASDLGSTDSARNLSQQPGTGQAAAPHWRTDPDNWIAGLASPAQSHPIEPAPVQQPLERASESWKPSQGGQGN